MPKGDSVMEPKHVVRILPNGDRETVLAAELKVGDRFIDELKQEGIVEQVHEDRIVYRFPDGAISLADIPKLRF
jgi:hypothetical protein